MLLHYIIYTINMYLLIQYFDLYKINDNYNIITYMIYNIWTL